MPTTTWPNDPRKTVLGQNTGFNFLSGYNGSSSPLAGYNGAFDSQWGPNPVFTAFADRQNRRPDGTINPQTRADQAAQAQLQGILNGVNFAGQFQDPYAPTVGETTGQSMEAMAKYLPGLYALMNQNIGAEASARSKATLANAPAEAELASRLFAQYAPQNQAVENRINASKRQGETLTDLGLLTGYTPALSGNPAVSGLPSGAVRTVDDISSPGNTSPGVAPGKGPGWQLAEASDALDRQINPEFYSQRKALSDKTLELVGGLNPNGLSGSEAAEVERANNIYNSGTGNIGNQSATSVVGNAMGFGDKLNQKKMQIAQIVAGAGATMGQFKTGVNPYGRSQDNSSSSTQFQTPQKTDSGSGYGFGTSFLNNVTSTAQQANDINSGRRDALDRLFQLQELQNLYS